MSLSPRKHVSVFEFLRPSLLLAAAGGVAALGAVTYVTLRSPVREVVAAAASPAQSAKSETREVSSSPVPATNATTPTTAIAVSPTPPPDPNFVSASALKIPGVTSPEAQRVLVDLQSAYRCLHTGSKRALAAWVPAPAADAPASLDDLSASMRLSLAKLPDACYVTTALPQVMNPRTPPMLMDILYADLNQRPNPIKLRTLFLIAGSESHPRAGDALQKLQAALNTDCQRDWSRWDEAISAQLVRESHGLRGLSCRMH